jgi:hypothetical protein
MVMAMNDQKNGTIIFAGGTGAFIVLCGYFCFRQDE